MTKKTMVTGIFSIIFVVMCIVLPFPELFVGSLLFVVWAAWMVFLCLKVLKPMRQNKQPAERVRIIGKRNDWDNHVVVFEFSDGSVKEFQLTEVGLFNAYRVNDTGMLTYKERENSEDYFSRVFVSFEKDY
jgi:hypothetical protein